MRIILDCQNEPGHISYGDKDIAFVETIDISATGNSGAGKNKHVLIEMDGKIGYVKYSDLKKAVDAL